MADGHRRVGVKYLGWKRRSTDSRPCPLSGGRETPATLNFEAAASPHQAGDRSARLYLAARHSYRGDDRARIAALADLAARVGIPLVATGGVLYHAPHRRPLQDVLTCIREKCTINDAGLRLEANAERHLKPARRWRACSKAMKMPSAAASRSPTPAPSPSTS